jgi:hypothetical protein
MTSTKRKVDTQDNYDSENYDNNKNQKLDLSLNLDLYDNCSWANKPIDITASMNAWKEFTHLLGYDHVWFSELGHPDSSKRDVPLLLPEVITSEAGLSFSVNPQQSIAQGQRFPAIADVYIGKSFYVMMPLRLSEAFSYPLGNYQRQFPPNKNGKPSKNHCPQTKNAIEENKLKYSYSFNTSAQDANFSIKDPISEEGMKWLQAYEEEYQRVCQPLKHQVGTKFGKTGDRYLEATWTPFIESKASDLDEKDLYIIHEEFADFQNKRKYTFNPIKGFRLNPARGGDANEPTLISVPSHEQHAYEQSGDIMLPVFKVSRFAGINKTICVDLHHLIYLESGYEGLPSEDWFNQASARLMIMTPEELYKRKQNTLKIYNK